MGHAFLEIRSVAFLKGDFPQSGDGFLPVFLYPFQQQAFLIAAVIHVQGIGPALDIVVPAAGNPGSPGSLVPGKFQAHEQGLVVPDRMELPFYGDGYSFFGHAAFLKAAGRIEASVQDVCHQSSGVIGIPVPHFRV